MYEVDVLMLSRVKATEDACLPAGPCGCASGFQAVKQPADLRHVKERVCVRSQHMHSIPLHLARSCARSSISACL